MEGNPLRPASKAEETKEKMYVLVDLLVKARLDRKLSRKQAAEEISKVYGKPVTIYQITAFETRTVIPAIPSKDMIDSISQVYGINKELLENTRTAAENARENEKEARKSLRKTTKSKTDKEHEGTRGGGSSGRQTWTRSSGSNY